ncbi:uncharacterized protein C17orf113-like [Ptychodera flava]|uniref:uncharacterized protein C17orf113-like n=1 Tax=Ptychodera flava TaxID=63121 RepID=UPI00396A4D18
MAGRVSGSRGSKRTSTAVNTLDTYFPELNNNDKEKQANQETTEKRRKVDRSSAKFLPEWKACFPWLEYDQDSKLMSCKWCKKAGNRNSFTSPGCPYLLKDYCTKHARISDHKAAAAARVYAPAFQDVVSNAYCKEEATVKAAMTNIYYMAKKNCPNDHFSDLNWLTIMQGCDELKGLKVDAHTNYEHPNSIHSFQEAMKLVIDEKMVLELQQSEFFAVLTDEMADIAMDKTVIII